METETLTVQEPERRQIIGTRTHQNETGEWVNEKYVVKTVYDGFSLRFYAEEKIWFKDAFEKTLTVPEAEILFSKLCRHFKLGQPLLEWTSGRNHPNCGGWKIRLNCDWNNFGVLAHELGHRVVGLQRRAKLGLNKGQAHGKELKKAMQRIVNYCTRKNWFATELATRTAPRPEKPEPTKQELRSKKITVQNEKIKRYKTKIRLYTTKLRKAQKSLSHLERWAKSPMGVGSEEQRQTSEVKP